MLSQYFSKPSVAGGMQITLFVALILISLVSIELGLPWALLVLILLGCGQFMLRGYRLILYSHTTLMALYLAWLFLASQFSRIPHYSLVMLSVLAVLPLTYLVVSNSKHFDLVWKFLQPLLFILSVIFAMWGIWQVYANIGRGHAIGPLTDRNAFAALLNMLWFPAVFLFVSRRYNQKNAWLGLLLGFGLFIISMALFATTSRGGIGIWLLLLPLVLWSGYRYTKSRITIELVVLIALLAYVSSVFLLQASIVDRNFDLSNDTSIGARFMMWQSSVNMMLAHPLIGTGWGTWADFYPAYRLPRESISAGFFAHNDYLQLAAEGGILAMILMLSILLSILKDLWHCLKSASNILFFERCALLLGVLAIFIHAGINFIFVFAIVNVVAGLFLARASQLTGVPKEFSIPLIQKIGVPIKSLIVGLILLGIFTPYMLHQFGILSLYGNRPALKAINSLAPAVNEFDVANAILAIRPKDFASQDFLLRTIEFYLANRAGSLTETEKQSLLNEAMVRFENVRRISADNPNTGLRQAELLIANHSNWRGDSALSMAHRVLDANLTSNPYHVNSMIAKARLLMMEGRREQAEKSLKLYERQALKQHDKLLILVELVRLSADTKFFPELDVIEKQLQNIVSENQAGIFSKQATASFYSKARKRLKQIADITEE